MAERTPEEANSPPANPAPAVPLIERRAVVAGVAAMIAGALTKATERSAAAADGEPLILGADNAAQNPTQLVTLGPPADVAPALVVENAGAGSAFLGRSADATAVIGVVGSTPLPVTVSAFRAGVIGGSDLGPGVVGVHGPEPFACPVTICQDLRLGVLGVGQDGWGVVGLDAADVSLSSALAVTITSGGLFGVSTDRVGVLGAALTPGGVGVSARNPSAGDALQVIGAARFSTSGKAIIPAKSFVHAVAHPAVTENSHVTVSLAGDSRKAAVAWVERQPGIGFVVHLSKKAKFDIPFTYLVVETGC